MNFSNRSRATAPFLRQFECCDTDSFDTHGRKFPAISCGDLSFIHLQGEGNFESKPHCSLYEQSLES